MIDDFLKEVMQKENDAIIFLYLVKSIEEGTSVDECLLKYEVEHEEIEPHFNFNDPINALAQRLEVHFNIRLVRRKEKVNIPVDVMDTIKFKIIRVLAHKLNIPF